MQNSIDAAKKPETIIAAGGTVLSLLGVMYLYTEMKAIKDGLEIIEAHNKQNTLKLASQDGIDIKFSQLANNLDVLRNDNDKLPDTFDRIGEQFKLILDEIETMRFQINSIVQILREQGKTVPDPPPKPMSLHLYGNRDIPRQSAKDGNDVVDRKSRKKEKSRRKHEESDSSDDSASDSSTSDDSSSDSSSSVEQKPSRRRRSERSSASKKGKKEKKEKKEKKGKKSTGSKKNPVDAILGN